MSVPRSASRPARIIGCIVVLIIVLLGGGILFALTQIPDVAHQLPPDSAPLIVNLTLPLNDSIVPLSRSLSIQADAIGVQPIESIELWVDGTKVDAKNPSRASLTRFNATWAWTPPDAGDHTLVVRAFDSQRRFTTSNAVRITASANANPVLALKYTPKAGDSLRSVAQTFNTTPPQIIALNPQFKPNDPIAPGQAISVPIPLQQVPDKPGKPIPTKEPSEPPTPKPALPIPTRTPKPPNSVPLTPAAPSNVGLWLNKNILHITSIQDLPAAPVLVTSPDGCNVKINILNNASNLDGVFVYRLDQQNNKFQRIATLAMASTSNKQWQFYQDKQVVGDVQYYVSAFNAAGETPSNIAGIKISSPACLSSVPHNLQLTNGQVTTTQPVDKLYCYLSLNNSEWTRVPAAPDTFVLPNRQGVFDVSNYVRSFSITPQQSGTPVALDCWGWAGGKLDYLGRAQETLNPAQQNIQIGNDKFKFTGGPIGPLCGSCAPTPAPNPPLYISPPYDVANTTSPSICAQHWNNLFAGPICEAAIAQSNEVVLVWNWTNFGAPSGYTAATDVDGFNIYEKDAYFQHTLLGSTTGGTGQTVYAFQLPPIFGISNANRCFTVTAIKGTLESADSDAFCLNGIPPGTQTITLQPAYQREVWHYFWEGSPCGGEGGFLVPPLRVGYYHENVDYCEEADAYRGLVQFDVSQIPGSIWTAQFTFDMIGGQIGSDGFTTQGEVMGPGAPSCASNILLPNSDWWSNGGAQDLVPGDPYLDVPAAHLTDDVFYSPTPSHFSFDVTSQVNAWQRNGGNYGFELAGYNENTDDPEDQEICYSDYQNFQLVVTYFPK